MLNFCKCFISIFIILILNINISFANSTMAKEEKMQFKTDLNQAILEVLNNTQIVNDIYNDSINLYSTCISGNSNELKKCSNQITQNAYKLSYIDLYNPLISVIKKYNVDIPNDENEYDFIYKRILKRYKIENANEYKQFVDNIDNKKAELLKISHNMIDSNISSIKPNKYAHNNNSYLDNTHIPAAQMVEEDIVTQPNSTNEESDIIVTVITIGFIVIILGCTYFLPATVAILKGHKNTCAVIVLNIFLGWTFIGWVIALVWACCNTKEPIKVIIKDK